jgi:hypothetical protein
MATEKTPPWRLKKCEIYHNKWSGLYQIALSCQNSAQILPSLGPHKELSPSEVANTPGSGEDASIIGGVGESHLIINSYIPLIERFSRSVP